MIRNASLVVMLTACANFACAQEFPLWERILSHYSGKTDETPVPSMKMGNHMQMSLKGKAQPGDEQGDIVALLVSGIPVFSITQIFGGVAISARPMASICCSPPLSVPAA